MKKTEDKNKCYFFCNNIEKLDIRLSTVFHWISGLGPAGYPVHPY